MAIDTGLAITCTDLQSTGGISQILLRSFATGDACTYDNSAANHSISSIVDTGSSTATWYVYEFKNETPTLAVAATKENGSTAFECTLAFYLSRMASSKFHELQNLLNECMMAIVVDTAGNNWVIGLSELYANEDVLSRNQTYLNLSGMEGATGAAYSEENGITVTLVARQFELPRLYTGTLTVDTSALTATTN
tara:strand:+ start:268 stop:849 length:582 start_codon:yes stop_codon:yes gene_type:complete